jgi:hypothetical protein
LQSNKGVFKNQKKQKKVRKEVSKIRRSRKKFQKAEEEEIEIKKKTTYFRRFVNYHTYRKSKG